MSVNPASLRALIHGVRGRVGRTRPPRTAFVLSGGASLGALQVGMLRALYERGIVPDLLIGASAAHARFRCRRGALSTRRSTASRC